MRRNRRFKIKIRQCTSKHTKMSYIFTKNCLPITIQILMDAATKSEACMAKKSPKDHNSTFSGYHGNILQIFWILVNHHPKGYLSWKFQLSSPDGHATSPWVTDFVTDRQAIYKLTRALTLSEGLVNEDASLTQKEIELYELDGKKPCSIINKCRRAWRSFAL